MLKAKHKTNGKYILTRPVRVDFSIGERDYAKNGIQFPPAPPSRYHKDRDHHSNRDYHHYDRNQRFYNKLILRLY
jgi:hypothetical protein